MTRTNFTSFEPLAGQYPTTLEGLVKKYTSEYVIEMRPKNPEPEDASVVFHVKVQAFSRRHAKRLARYFSAFDVKVRPLQEEPNPVLRWMGTASGRWSGQARTVENVDRPFPPVNQGVRKSV